MKYTYDDLHFYEWMLKDLKKNPVSKTEKVEERIVEMKRQLRAKNKDTDERVVFCNDFDGCIVKFPLPCDIRSDEEAREWFRDYEYIEYRPTYYDCTGQLFTSWYKIFQKPDGRFWAYHSIGRDV